MNYVVLDMEWNQPNNWNATIKTPVLLRGEIVQIGAVKVDSDFRLIDTFKLMVLPKYYTSMNTKVMLLTGITNVELRRGIPFPEAIERFREWCGESFAFLTWGPDDIFMLRDNIALHGLDSGWIPECYNVQVIFAAQIAKENRQISLSSAMAMVEETELEAHDALNDAKNAVTVCRHLDMKDGLANFAELQKQMKCGAPRVRDESVKAYVSPAEALEDRSVTYVRCPVCRGKCTCTGVVRQNFSKLIGVARCPRGHELFVRFRIIRWSDGLITLSKRVYEMTEENRIFYAMKKRKNEEVLSGTR